MLRELIVTSFPGSSYSPLTRVIVDVHPIAPTGPNGSRHGSEFWSQFEQFRPNYFAVGGLAYLSLNGAYMTVEKADEVRKKFLVGESRPFLKEESWEMEEWLTSKHRTNTYYLLRGSLTYDTTSINCVYTVAGSCEPGCNGLWGIKEEGVTALEGHKRGRGRVFEVYNDMQMLAQATFYVQRYDLIIKKTRILILTDT